MSWWGQSKCLLEHGVAVTVLRLLAVELAVESRPAWGSWIRRLDYDMRTRPAQSPFLHGDVGHASRNPGAGRP